MNMTVLDRNIDVSYLNKELYDENGHLKIKDASFYEGIPHTHLMLWCHQHGQYGLPTTELIAWLKNHVIEGATIQVGAGNDSIGRTLGIPFTDSCLMKVPEVAAYYAMGGQPITKYPDDIIELEAAAAIKKYKPKVVIGCWITHLYREDEHFRGGNMYGIDEDFILDNVDKYIVIGNNKTHDKKRIIERKHTTHKFPWLFSRSMYPLENMIYVWENEHKRRRIE